MKTKNRKTHFEQVPLEQVAELLRKTADKADADKADNEKLRLKRDVVIERPDAKTEPYSIHRGL